jgi:regulatory factor X
VLLLNILPKEILEFLRSQMLSPIPASSLSSLRQLALKMEKILLVALENYGNTFVEPKVELGARFGHLVCKSHSLRVFTVMI